MVHKYGDVFFGTRINAGKRTRSLPASAARRAALRAVCFFRSPESNAPGQNITILNKAGPLDSGLRKKQLRSRQAPGTFARGSFLRHPRSSVFIRVPRNTSLCLWNRVLSARRRTHFLSVRLRACDEMSDALRCWPPGPMARRERRAYRVACKERTTQPRACGPQPEGARRRAGICFVAAPRRWHRIACVAAPCICPPGARAEVRHLFRHRPLPGEICVRLRPEFAGFLSYESLPLRINFEARNSAPNRHYPGVK